MKQYLPSKKFLKFIGLIILIGLVIWLVSIIFFKKQIYQNKAQDNVVSVDDNPYSVDSDKDGLYDWEEGLWQTDANRADTDGDGISDLQEIDARKELLQESDKTDETKEEKELNQTEMFARQVLATASLLDQQGELSEEGLKAFADSFETTLNNSKIKDPFTLLDIKLATMTPVEYDAKLKTAFGGFIKADLTELDIIYRFAAGEEGTLAEMDKLISLYNELSNNLLKTPAPHNAAGLHLMLINNTAKITIALINLKSLKDDPLIALIGIRQYEEYSAELKETGRSLLKYFN